MPGQTAMGPERKDAPKKRIPTWIAVGDSGNGNCAVVQSSISLPAGSIATPGSIATLPAEFLFNVETFRP